MINQPQSPEKSPEAEGLIIKHLAKVERATPLAEHAIYGQYPELFTAQPSDEVTDYYQNEGPVDTSATEAGQQNIEAIRAAIEDIQNGNIT